MITVVVPAAVASSAATSLVDIPPVPRDEPRDEIDTGQCVSYATSKSIQRTLLSDLLDIPNDSNWLGVGVIARIVRIPGTHVSQPHTC